MLSLKPDIDRIQADADFIEAALRLAPRSEVLDLACGAGRHSLELAECGHHVTGVDITHAFRVDAQRQASERGLAEDVHLP